MTDHRHILAGTIIALTATAATAGPDRAYILAGSKHLGTDYDFNEVNPGLFLTWELDRFDVTVGAYHNSYGKGSMAASVAYPLVRGDDWSVDAFAGLATYFGTHNPDVVPMAGLQARYGPAFVQYVPVPGGQYISGLISFGLTFEIED